MTPVLTTPPELFHPIFGGRWSREPLQEDGTPYPSMGFLAATWVQARTQITLDPWQVELFRRGMLYHPDTLDWVVRDVIVVGPEGIGKSALWGRLGLWYLEGPCLPPEEAPSTYPDPDIPVVSAALTLTEHIWRFAKKAIENGPLEGRIVVEKTRIFRANAPDDRIAFPAASGAYQQGKNPKPVILEEELHVLNAPGVKADGEETIEIVSSKRSKTPWPKVQRWTITNPDDGDPDSLLGKRWLHAQRVLSGEIVDPELLVIHYHAREPWNLNDPQDMRRGLHEATPSSWSDVEAIAAKYEKDHQSAPRFKRFSGGLFVAGENALFDNGVLEAREVPEAYRMKPPKWMPVALAFDGARNRDSCGLTGCTPDAYGWVQGHWERPPTVKPEDFSYKREFADEIHATVEEAMEVLWPKAMLAVDDQWWEQEADEWELRWPGRVVRGYQDEGPAAWEGFRRAVLDEEWTHDGYEALYRHMRNAREYYNPRQKTAKLVKRRDDGNHPIDLLVCATYAHRLSQHLDAGEEDLDAWREALGLTEEGA